MGRWGGGRVGHCKSIKRVVVRLTQSLPLSPVFRARRLRRQCGRDTIHPDFFSFDVLTLIRFSCTLSLHFGSPRVVNRRHYVPYRLTQTNVKKSIKKEEAEELKLRLEAAGGVVEIV